MMQPATRSAQQPGTISPTPVVAGAVPSFVTGRRQQQEY